jgi:hypothetical protein
MSKAGTQCPGNIQRKLSTKPESDPSESRYRVLKHNRLNFGSNARLPGFRSKRGHLFIGRQMHGSDRHRTRQRELSSAATSVLLRVDYCGSQRPNDGTDIAYAAAIAAHLNGNLLNWNTLDPNITSKSYNSNLRCHFSATERSNETLSNN